MKDIIATDLAIVGAGPQGIGMAAMQHISSSSRPYRIFDSQPPGQGFVHGLQAMGISDLRSSGQHGLDHHVWKYVYSGGGEAPNKPEGYLYKPQTTRDLMDQVNAWRNIISPHHVSADIRHIQPDERIGFILRDRNSTIWHAKHVVLATGIGSPYVPESFPQNSGVLHSSQIDVRKNMPSGQVAILGSGESAAVTAANILERNRRVVVTLITRRDFRMSQTEIDPYCFTPDYRNWFIKQKLPDRVNILATIRSQTAMTPVTYTRLTAHPDRFRHVVNQDPTIDGVDGSGITIGGARYDSCIAATGYRWRVRQILYLFPPDVHDQIPVEPTTGLPDITEHFMVKDIPGLYITGRGSELRSGPGGRNLGQSFMSADMIQSHISGERGVYT